MSTNASTNWTCYSVAGHSCELFTPSTIVEPGRMILYLHDLQEHTPKDFPALQKALEFAGLPVLAPRIGRSWGLQQTLTRFDAAMSAENYILGPILKECHRIIGECRGGVGLLGYDMGGQAALRLAYRHPGKFPIAAAIAPAIDFHLSMRHGHNWIDGELYDTLWEIFDEPEQARQETAVLHIHPLNWPRHQWFVSSRNDERWHDGAVRLSSKLIALGIPHTAIIDENNNEDILSTFVDDAIEFIMKSLDSEARRVN